MINKYIKLTIISFIAFGVIPLLTISNRAQAATPPTLNEVVDNIQKQYEKMRELEADFVQESFNKTLRKSQKAQGKLYMKKPGLMHWDYQKPEKQIIVVDGKFFWWYTPHTKQVIQQKFDQAMDSNLAITFMGGLGKMQEDFKIDFASKPKAGKPFELKLVPSRPQANVVHLIQTVNAKTYQTQKVALQDFYGNITTISFTNMKINPGLEKSLFEFIPPLGTQVITPEDFPPGIGR